MTDIAARTERTLASLKDFQRATVDYAFERLWLADDPVKKFLVADEVGLGKTMVAKGLIAKTVEHLWETDKRIDVVYICSNSQIARQNLSRLNVVGGSELKHADRLTLLPKVIRKHARPAHQLRVLHPGNVLPGRPLRGRSTRTSAALLDVRQDLGLRDHWTSSVEEVLPGWQVAGELRA